MNWFNRGKSFSIYGLGQSVNLLTPLLITPYIIQKSGEVGLGKIGICLSVCFILMGILDYSSYLQGTKLIAIKKLDKVYLSQLISAIYSYKLIIILGMTIPLILITVFVFTSYKTVFLLSTTMLIGHLLNPNWILYGLARYTETAIYNIISKALYVLGVFMILQSSEDYIWVNFLNGLCSTLVYGVACVRLSKEFKLHINKNSFRQGILILKNDYKISLSEFCLSIYQFFPIIIIGIFTGAYAAGIFRIIEQIYSVFRTFIFMFFNFSYPTVCDEINQSIPKGIKLWRIYQLFNLCLVVLGCTMVAIFWREVLNFFHVADHDIIEVRQLLYIAMLIPIISVISQALRQLLLALNLMQWYSNIVYAFTFFNMVCMLILVPWLGLEGSVIAIILSEIFAIILYSLYIHKFSTKWNLN